MQDGLLSITEMARLRGITTETLRHYDRIGLLKPDELDENNVRYYSVLDYEKLGTIRELQQIGLSLKEIAEYLNHRTVQSSYELLIRQQKYYEDKIRKFRAIKNKVDQKTRFMEEIAQQGSHPEYFKIQHTGTRYCLKAASVVDDEVSLGYGCMELERIAKEYGLFIPVYASDSYAGRFLWNQEGPDTELLMILDKKPRGKKHELVLLPEGDYLCFRQQGSFWKRKEAQDAVQRYCVQNNIKKSEDAIVISKIDYSITDIEDERMCEFQARIISA